MLEFLGILALTVVGFIAGGGVMTYAVYRGIQRHVAAGEMTLDGVTYSITPTAGNQGSNLVLRFKEAIATGMLDGEIGRAVLRNQQRAGR
jgi:hypothetical protein